MKVSEVAELLGVSPRTVYRRIATLSLTVKGHVSQVGKVKSVDLEGIELIRASLGEVCHCDKIKGAVTAVAENSSDERTIDSYKTLLLEQKQLYEKLLLEKDRLIDDLRKDKDKLMKMQENNQVLLVREQERTLLLEESVEKKGFWSKFKKSQPNFD